MTPLLEHLKEGIYGGEHVVYLIHLHEPMKHARHYVGSTGNLVERMRCYRAGNADASAFMRAVHAAGITWTVARVWSFPSEREARDWEYQFKKGATGYQRRKPSRDCPYCRAEAMARNASRMRALRATRAEAAA